MNREGWALLALLVGAALLLAAVIYAVNVEPSPVCKGHGGVRLAGSDRALCSDGEVVPR